MWCVRIRRQTRFAALAFEQFLAVRLRMVGRHARSYRDGAHWQAPKVLGRGRGMSGVVA